MDHSLLFTPDPKIKKNESKVVAVIVLTFVMMVIEIIAGTITGSMALLADGWHMASHAGALIITFLAYRMARSERVSAQLTFGAGKVIPLGGYTSAILLTLVAAFMIYESALRLFAPIAINYKEALIVTVIGLIVNLLSAWLLGEEGHSHNHQHGESCSHGHSQDDKHSQFHDHNLRGAYMHVLADALTSVFALIALAVGLWMGISWLDPVVGIIASIVIFKWAWDLVKETGSELLDVHSKTIPSEEIRRFLTSSGAEVLDIHIWRVAPHALACEIVLVSKDRDTMHFREILLKKFSIQHLVVEVRNF